MSYTLNVNGEDRTIDVPQDNTPLLWVLRQALGLKGTKFGCGSGFCGACTVHITGSGLPNGSRLLSCVISGQEVSNAGWAVTTIEGLADDDPVKQAWIDQQVPQCGYCQPGMIMATKSLLANNPNPSDQDIDAAIPNLCRCGTYLRIRKAIHQAARMEVNT